jgi:PKD repeat protein
VKYLWDFGDGSGAEGKTAYHVYQKGGSYTAVLTIDDGRGLPCSISRRTINVMLDEPPVAKIAPIKPVCLNEGIIFDGSSSYDPEGNKLSYLWDFGDGATAEGEKAEHVYQRGGIYRVRLTVDDGSASQCAKASDTMAIKVNAGPRVVLAKMGKVCPGKNITFNASGSSDYEGRELSYYWDFGDGERKEGPSQITHAYGEGGEYTVKVTVDDASGSTCSQSSDTIKVSVNRPPIVKIGPNLACCAKVETVFDASDSSDPDGDTLSYYWDFGDGTTAEGAQVKHAFSKSGVYKIRLLVKDGSGTPCGTSGVSFTATISEKPVPIIKCR